MGDGMTQRVALPFFGLDPLPWQRPALASFSTWLNQTPSGLGTTTATDNANGLPLVIHGALDGNSNYCASGKLKSIGSPPWTITCAVAAIGNWSGDPSLFWYPLILRNSGNDKGICLSWWTGQSNANSHPGACHIWHFDDISTGEAATSVDINTPANRGYGFPVGDYFSWFRVNNDGTDLTFEISQEGVLFMPLPYSETLADYIGAVDQVGFGIDRFNNPGSDNIQAATALWSWVES